MNKKGFTLIELLGVIVILGIIALIAVPIVQNEIRKSSEKTCQKQVKSFERAAKNYVASNPYNDYSGIVTLTTLQEKGFLENKDLKIPGTDETFEGSVTIAYNDETSKYTYVYEDNPCETIYKEGRNTKKRTNPEGETETTSRTLAKATFKENSPGEVTITFPDGCTKANDLLCTYQKNSEDEVTVNTKNVTIPFNESGNIIANISRKSNSSVKTSSNYTLTKDKLYVSNSGNDETGYGTISAPYATIAKAYDSADNYSDNTIYIMNNISQSSIITMSQNKNVTLTSSNATGTTGSSIINKVTKAQALSDNMIKETNGSLTLQNITIDGNNISDSASGLRINSKLTINENATITKFVSTSSNGGAIHTDAEKTTITMNGGTISNNKSPFGGGIFIGTQTTLNIKGGSISANNSTGSGGGIGANGNATINQSGGTIIGNTSTVHGGGVAFESTTGAMNISSGSIKNNVAGNSGGGVNYGTITMSGGTVAGNSNTGYDGGGLSAYKITMTGGIITGNTANNYGGGVVCINNCSLTGGSITGNKATNVYGGGVWNKPGSSLTVAGTATINNNTSSHIVSYNFQNDGTIKEQTNDFTFINSDIYKIVLNASQNFVVDVENGVDADGRNISLFSWGGGNNQKWKILPATLENGTLYHLIQSQIAGTRYINIDGDSSANGKNVHTWKQADTWFYIGNLWRFEKMANGVYRFRNKPGSCLDLDAGDRAENWKNTQNIHGWSCNETTAQKWKIVKVN